MSTRLTLRMAAPSCAISLLLLVLAGLGGWYVQHLQKSTAALVALDMSTIQAVQRLVLSIHEVRGELADFLQTGDEAHLRAVPDKCAQVEIWLDEAERLVDVAPKTGMASHIRYGHQMFLEEFRHLAAAPPSEARRRDLERLNDDMAVRQVLAPAQKLLALGEKLGSQNSDYNQALAGRIAMVLWLLGACGAVAGLVAGFGIARGVSRSIVELYVPVRTASGRLEEVIGPVDVVPAAGIENLDAILRRMADHVGTVVDRLRQSQLEVLRAEQMAALGQLSAGLAHELRNPLTAMKILIQAAAREGPGASLGGRDLEVLEAETTRLERSIQAFLDFARPPTLEKRRADIRQALRQTVELVHARANRQCVQIGCRLPDEPLVIEADHEQLRQVFLNLLFNALDCLPRGGRIEVAASESKEWIVIAISDDGPGLPADLGERIFDPYVSRKETGLGLGLAICRRIVDSHGGRISAANAATGGAVFTVHLPSHDGVPGA